MVALYTWLGDSVMSSRKQALQLSLQSPSASVSPLSDTDGCCSSKHKVLNTAGKGRSKSPPPRTCLYQQEKLSRKPAPPKEISPVSLVRTHPPIRGSTAGKEEWLTSITYPVALNKKNKK